MSAFVNGPKGLPPGASGQNPGRGLGILLIEDDLALAGGLVKVLEQFGFEVTHAPDGPSGLRRLAEPKRTDLVLLDWTLPGMDGLEFLGHLRRHRPDLPVIMASAHSGMDNVRRALAAGANYFLVKPLQTARLIPKIFELLGMAIDGSPLAAKPADPVAPAQPKAASSASLADMPTMLDISAAEVIQAAGNAAPPRPVSGRFPQLSPAGRPDETLTNVPAANKSGMASLGRPEGKKSSDTTSVFRTPPPAFLAERSLQIAASAEVTLVDLSRGGCCIESTFPIKMDSVFFLDLDSLARKLDIPEDISVASRVCNCRPSGKRYRLGCQFVGLERELEEKLDRICAASHVQVGGGAKASNRNSSSANVKKAPEKAPTILAVDEDQSVLDLLAETLSRQGFNLVPCRLSADALETIRQNKGVDAVLLDWTPDAFGFLRELVAFDPHPEVLMLGAPERLPEVPEAVKNGAVDFLPKPIDREEVVFKLKNVLHWDAYENRQRKHARRKVVQKAEVSFTVSQVSADGVKLSSTFPFEPGSVVFLRSDTLEHNLDVERGKRFSLKILDCSGGGNSYSSSSVFFSLPPAITDRIRKVFG